MACPFSHFSRIAPDVFESRGHEPPAAWSASTAAGPPRMRSRRAAGSPHVGPAFPGRLDGIDRFAVALLVWGVLTFLIGMWMEPSVSLVWAVERHYADWAPGLVTDGVLLLVVNSILRRHERRRILSQIGSLSREFALDAVRRARSEGWLTDGSMRGMALSRAPLAGVDLSGGLLEDVDLSYSDLGGATLAYADLRRADLTGSNLGEADLRWADLRGATLRWADLRGAMLDGAILDRIDTTFASVDARVAGTAGFSQAIIGGFLDDEQVAEVRRTFDRLMAAGATPIEVFYDRLFRELPEARSMFRTEPRTQARKFLQSLKVIVSALQAPHRHVAVLQRLGERHDSYGVRAEHYPVVARTLLDVLEEALGPDFTPEARLAWERAFVLITTVMIGGAPASSGPAPRAPAARPTGLVA